jgi:hypothetical protein
VALLAVVVLTAAPLPTRGQDDDDRILVEVGKFRVEERGYFHRLIHDGIMIATQIHQPYLSRYDAPNPFGALSPWDVLALEGALVAWNPTQEPLAYHHRAGPVGAVFHELRSRRNGAGAKEVIGALGMFGGAPACYALPGQHITFYESRPDLKKLVADTDRYFTYVADARRRGVKIDYRMGNVRKNLNEDADRKYTLLLVEMINDSFDPGDRLTLEALKLYADRTTDDGIIALHVSNRCFRLEPIIAAIAAELGLVGRVWHDDSESRPGKTASSWVVLAKSEKALGVLGRPTTEQVLAYGTKNLPLVRLLRKYGPETAATEAVGREWGERGRPADWRTRTDTQEAAVLEHLRRADAKGMCPTLGDLTEFVYGPIFRPLGREGGIGPRRDGDTSWPPGTAFLPRWLETFLWLRRPFE